MLVGRNRLLILDSLTCPTANPLRTRSSEGSNIQTEKRLGQLPHNPDRNCCWCCCCNCCRY